TIAKTIEPYFKDTDLDMLASSVERYKKQDSFATDPLLEKAAWDNLQEIMDTAGELPGKAPYDKLVDSDFAELATKKQEGWNMSYCHIKHVIQLVFNRHVFTKALEDVDCAIEEGEFLSILGPSGCGKSTLLSILAGITEETFGQISLRQKPLKQSKEKIGYMLQQDYLFPWKTIIDNILLGPKVQKEPLSKAEEKAHTLLEEVGLPDISHQYPNSLSGGMRQRVALVRTLINDPSIFLLDEPFSALDYFTKL